MSSQPSSLPGHLTTICCPCSRTCRWSYRRAFQILPKKPPSENGRMARRTKKMRKRAHPPTQPGATVPADSGYKLIREPHQGTALICEISLGQTNKIPEETGDVKKGRKRSIQIDSAYCTVLIQAAARSEVTNNVSSCEHHHHHRLRRRFHLERRKISVH